MFKQILSGVSKFFTKERVLVLVIFLVLAWALFSYSGSKMNIHDSMGDGSAVHTETTTPANHSILASSTAPTAGAAVSNNGYSQQHVANPSDLLPKDSNSQWSALNPNSMNGGDILMPDLLQAGYHIGLDTIGQTLRNPNLQLRSDPIISKVDVGPWHQSTIEADYGRVPLELGNCPK